VPAHKKYLCIYWKDLIYVQHIAIEVLATAGGIQGNVADTTIAILKVHDIKLIIKWVDNFIFFRYPLFALSNSTRPSYKFKLQDIPNATSPLGIPWHPISCKGHDFRTSYIGFKWDLSLHSVSLSSEKHLCLLAKVSAILYKPSS